MRNIFDQYSQSENRVTHALVTALHEDRKLLRAFLIDIANCPPPKEKCTIEISEQTYPGEPEAEEEGEEEEDEDEIERRSIPDAWITAGDDWCLVIENKVLMKPKRIQLDRHLETAKRLGHADPVILLLTVKDPDGEMPPGTRVVEWCTVYRWLIEKAQESPWARRVAEFLEVMEGRLVDEKKQDFDGTLTAFYGFPFGDNPFSYPEARRILRLATKELRSRNDLKSKLGMDPKLSGKKAIKRGDDDNVWDYLQFGVARKEEKFTKFPHLTLGIRRTQVEAMITIPNAMRPEFRQRMLGLDPEGFRDLVHDVLERMLPILAACKGMEPRFHVIQRRFPPGTSVPFQDAVINFDLRTCFDGVGPPKTEPQWLDAVYGCLARRKANIQVQIGAWFPYRTCDAIGSVDALNYVAAAWIACRPFIEVLMPDGPD